MMMCLITDISSFFMIYAITERYMTHTVVRIMTLCCVTIFSWKGMNKGTILLYGHTHNSAEDVYFQKCLTGMEANNCRHVGDKPIQAYNVGCMKPWIDYEPRSLKEIIEKYHNIK